MASLFTLDFNPPQELATTEFILFPTNDKYNQYDYVAVMRNIELLRIWSQSTWPEDDFSPKQNKEDLQKHIEDNRTHTAYGYMLFEPEFAKCYGSVYVNPLEVVKNNYELTSEQRNILDQYDARVDFWVIEDSSDLEKIITEELRDWFKNVWKINVLFSARVGLNKRVEIYNELGIESKMALKSKTSEMNLLLF